MTSSTLTSRPRKKVVRKSGNPTTKTTTPPQEDRIIAVNHSWVNPHGFAWWNNTGRLLLSSDPSWPEGLINEPTINLCGGEVVDLGIRPTRHSFLCALRAWERKYEKANPTPHQG